MNMNEKIFLVDEATDAIEDEIQRDRRFDGYRVAKTINGRGLVTDVLAALAILEQHDAEHAGSTQRKRARRPADKERYEQQVEALVADLAVRHLEMPGAWLFVTRAKVNLSGKGKSRYDPRFITEKVVDVMDAMARLELELCDLRVAKPRGPSARGPALQSTMRAGRKLIERIEERGLSRQDFGIQPGEEVIVLKGSKRRRNDVRSWVNYVDEPATDLMRDRLQIVNRHLEGASLGYQPPSERAAYHPSAESVDTSERLLHRIFVNDRFDQHGRMYGGFWIPMTGEQRLACLTIDGEPVADLDFGQIAVRLMYAKAGVHPTFQDAYAVPGLESFRDGVKKVINSMVSVHRPLARFPKGTKAFFVGMRDGVVFPPRVERGAINFQNVLAWILEFHAPIADRFFKGGSLDVHFMESQIMVEALLRLVSKGITALPVHDGLLVAKSQAAVAHDTMMDAFHDATGHQGKVTITT